MRPRPPTVVAPNAGLTHVDVEIGEVCTGQVVEVAATLGEPGQGLIRIGERAETEDRIASETKHGSLSGFQFELPDIGPVSILLWSYIRGEKAVGP